MENYYKFYSSKKTIENIITIEKNNDFVKIEIVNELFCGF